MALTRMLDTETIDYSPDQTALTFLGDCSYHDGLLISRVFHHQCPNIQKVGVFAITLKQKCDVGFKNCDFTDIDLSFPDIRPPSLLNT